MTDLAHVDWPRVARNIRRRYQARDLDGVMSWVTLGKLARGENIEPSWYQGILLLNMHHDRCPEEHTPSKLLLGPETTKGRARRVGDE